MQTNKKTPHFLCDGCGHGSPRWFGRCPECGAWNTASERRLGTTNPVVAAPLSARGPLPPRLRTGIDELDRVAGGGLVPGAVVLLAGEPGIGKSTLVLQLLDALAGNGAGVLLAAGEESIDQIALRGARLGVDAGNLKAVATTSLEALLDVASSEAPDVIVVDSIQTLESAQAGQVAGSVTQIKECAAGLIRHAKDAGCVMVLVGHVTKDGAVAGPKTLEHVVDVVLTLEGERSGSLRTLKAVKNRFGSCEETGVFVMGSDGLEPVEDASALLLGDRRAGVPGSIVFPALEGTRTLLVEVQALRSHATNPHPRRVALGVDPSRIAMVLGVLEQRAGVAFGSHDVFVTAAGGVRTFEPACDLPAALALASAAGNLPLDAGLVALGEVGLAGEIRRVPGIERRLAEAVRCGFTSALVPPGCERVPHRIDVKEVGLVSEALEAALDAGAPAGAARAPRGPRAGAGEARATLDARPSSRPISSQSGAAARS
jgi:DNA repair protein RadA/Sms